LAIAGGGFGNVDWAMRAAIRAGGGDGWVLCCACPTVKLCEEFSFFTAASDCLSPHVMMLLLLLLLMMMTMHR
jgi:hypothetical protein